MSGAIAHIAVGVLGLESINWTTIFPEVFGQEYFDIPPPWRPRVDLDIELKEGARLYHSQLYPLPKAYCTELWKWIDENLATGCIY